MRPTAQWLRLSPVTGSGRTIERSMSTEMPSSTYTWRSASVNEPNASDASCSASHAMITLQRRRGARDRDRARDLRLAAAVDARRAEAGVHRAAVELREQPVARLAVLAREVAAAGEVDRRADELVRRAVAERPCVVRQRAPVV